MLEKKVQDKEDGNYGQRVYNTLSLKDKPKSRMRAELQCCSSKIPFNYRKIILCLNEICIKFDKSKLPRNI